MIKVKPGAVFGRITVVTETSERIRGAKVWNCECECGKELKVKTDYLQQGWTKSCGCLRSERAKNRLSVVWDANPKKNSLPSIYKFNTLMAHYKNNAVKRNLEFILDTQEVYDIVILDCHYCGFNPSNLKAEFKPSVNCQSYSEIFNGIDRIDSSLGYTKENVLPCCKICNRAKNNMSYADFLEYLDRMYNFRKETNELIEP